jgi:hypothetical protein
MGLQLASVVTESVRDLEAELTLFHAVQGGRYRPHAIQDGSASAYVFNQGVNFNVPVCWRGWIIAEGYSQLEDLVFEGVGGHGGGGVCRF